MKHLILQDDELSFMVYYQPRKKGQMFDLIFKSQQEYWKSDYENSDWGLLLTMIIKLQENGFKCVDITKEIDDKINVYSDLEIDSLVYRGVKIIQSQYGFSFYSNQSYKSFNSVLNIEDAIKIIDKELA